jgi:V8-like Glu-specific endopeptidase
MKNDLIENGNGRFTLRHKRFGDTFNLCCAEHFYDQPIAAGRICTGFIVKEDVMVTAGHCVYKKNLSDLRIVFGYNKSDFEKPATQVSNNKIYKAKKVIHIVYDPEGTGADWALVKLDRKVEGPGVVTLSPKNISLEKQVYTLGYPCGLPLKYARGAYVRDMSKAFFSSDLSVYSGNSGSPVFNYDTHEVVGIVARGDSQDFRWTGRGWLSITYPCRGFRSKAPQCTKVSEFSDYL